MQVFPRLLVLVEGAALKSMLVPPLQLVPEPGPAPPRPVTLVGDDQECALPDLAHSEFFTIKESSLHVQL